MSSLLGPMIKILITMTSNIFQVGIIYLVALVFFEAIGLFLFTYTETFNSYSLAFLYLFSASLGSYDLIIFDATEEYVA
jgi:hypothetical protein